MLKVTPPLYKSVLVSVFCATDRVLAALFRGLIQIYRWTLSPYFGKSCRFEPTCSAYGMIAIETHGGMKGSWLTIRRLCRCHPIKALGGGFGFDPVPPRDRRSPFTCTKPTTLETQDQSQT